MEWRPVAETNGEYLVSYAGEVKNAITGDVLKHSVDYDGYHLVHLQMNGNTLYRRVHRLVAAAFLPNPDNKPTVNHIDENKDNNCASNLEWATYKEQVNHGTRNKRAMETMASCRVIQLDLENHAIAVYESVRDAARALGVKAERILSVLKGRQNTSCGYKWVYEDEGCGHKTGRKRSTGVVQLTPDGEVVARHRSIQAAAKALGISPAGIWECIYGNRKTNKGFLWEEDLNPIAEYEPPTIPIEQLDADGNFIMRFSSVSDAARAVGGSTGDICRCLKGRRKTSGGYKWKYA